MLTNTLALRKEIAHLISAKKKVKISKLNHSTFSALGFDELDVVEMILEVEKKYHLVIPDELPLKTIDDFVQFVGSPELKQAS
ncbi:acyl carrier protein [Adhaeribacter terreus]|uniref:Acyl carrier protein n=1 Tax=Adhaeribacter terreus TaxID=529703 RepID=A0ABW0EGE3_9BACT